MKIEKLPSGKYRLRKTFKGHTYTIILDYRPSQREAMRLMSERLEQAPAQGGARTFQRAAEDYIRVKRNVLSPSTVRGYESVLRCISEDFRNTRLCDLAAPDVQREVNDYSASHSPKSVRNLHGFISAVLSMYVPGLQLHTTLPQKEEHEDYIPTEDDVKAILQASQGTRYESAILLAVFGLRRSELCALKPADIGDGWISVSKAKVKNDSEEWVIKQTKTAAGTRIVHVPREVTDRIRQAGLYEGDPHAIYKWLQRTQELLGIPRFPLHKFRHYYASACHYLGIPDHYIMQSGGWKTDSVMKAVYRHALSDREKEIQEKSDDYFKSLIS